MVVKGDTLSTIAKKYGTTVEAIAESNGIKNINQISFGYKLVIPNTATTSKFPYTVQITCNVLNVRKDAGNKFAITTSVKRNEIYTIISKQNGWGELKSGAVWINLSYTQAK